MKIFLHTKRNSSLLFFLFIYLFVLKKDEETSSINFDCTVVVTSVLSLMANMVRLTTYTIAPIVCTTCENSLIPNAVRFIVHTSFVERIKFKDLFRFYLFLSFQLKPFLYSVID